MNTDLRAGKKGMDGVPLRLLVALSLIQDLDLLLPVLRAADRDPRFEARVWVSDVLAGHPRLAAALGERSWSSWPTYATGGLGAPLSVFDALLTASESSASGHRRTRQLVALANGLGLHTATVQHGVETLGLTMRPEDPLVPVDFASSRILTWADPEGLPGWLPPRTRARCRATGRPSRAPSPDATTLLGDEGRRERSRRPRLGVFENLHWSRYDSAYLEWFLACLADTARALPETHIILIPHPAGRFTDRVTASLPTNITRLDGPDHRRFTATDLLPLLDRAITTPSTVALDAARLGCPVAVAAEMLDLPAYRPLPMLRHATDWHAFASGKDDASVRAAGETFSSRVARPGDASQRILDTIARDCTEATPLPRLRARRSGHGESGVPRPTEADPIRIFVGCDRSQQLACDVLEHSIRARTERPVRLISMCELPITPPAAPERRARTGFSFSRFAVPRLAGRRGRAIYLDADMLVLTDIAGLWFMRLDGRRLLAARQRPQGITPRYRTAAMLLDCGALDWDAQAIVDGLDAGRYDYDALVSGLCLLEPGQIADWLPDEWNHEDVRDASTALLHYTDMERQPWVSPGHPFGHLWIDELRGMLSAGVIDETRLRAEIAEGHARPSLLAELERPPNGGPLLSDEIASYRRIDEAAGFEPHRRLRDALAAPTPKRRWRRLFAG